MQAIQIETNCYMEVPAGGVEGKGPVGGALSTAFWRTGSADFSEAHIFQPQSLCLIIGNRPAMTVVYQLRKNTQYIKAVQKASLTTQDFGIEPSHGLFGSDEWWEHISRGTLPVHTLSGHITKVYMASMNDWPEFAMTTEQGEEFKWTRELNDAALDSLYQVGHRVEVDYVEQRHRKPLWGLGQDTKCVVEIRIAENSK